MTTEQDQRRWQLTDGEPSRGAGDKAGNDEDQVSRRSGILLKIRDKLHAYCAKGKDPEYRKERRERITIFVIVITAFLVLLQTHEMIKVYGPIKTQADAAMIQAEAAKAAIDQQLRAYLIVDHKSPNVRGSHVDMDAMVHFVGATPAYEVWFKGIIKIADSDKNLGDIWHMQGVTERDWPNFYGSIPKTVNISGTFPRDEIEAMKQKGQRFYVFGSVCHVTNLKERRQYNFCFSFAPDGKQEDGKDACQIENINISQFECPRPGWGYKHNGQLH